MDEDENKISTYTFTFGFSFWNMYLTYSKDNSKFKKTEEANPKMKNKWT